MNNVKLVKNLDFYEFLLSNHENLLAYKFLYKFKNNMRLLNTSLKLTSLKNTRDNDDYDYNIIEDSLSLSSMMKINERYNCEKVRNMDIRYANDYYFLSLDFSGESSEISNLKVAINSTCSIMLFSLSKMKRFGLKPLKISELFSLFRTKRFKLNMLMKADIDSSNMQLYLENGARYIYYGPGEDEINNFSWNELISESKNPQDYILKSLKYEDLKV